jgi:hypothetical protein
VSSTKTDLEGVQAYADAKDVGQHDPEKRQEGRWHETRSHAVVRGVFGVDEASKHENRGRI